MKFERLIKPILRHNDEKKISENNKKSSREEGSEGSSGGDFNSREWERREGGEWDFKSGSEWIQQNCD